MDLLGSILNSMDKPPSVSEKQKSLMKKQRDEMLKKQKAEKEKLKKFREEMDKKINVFLQDDKETRLRFTPMDQVYRGIIHDVAEVAGLMAQSFGEEGVDRYIILFKKEFPPSEDEITTLRNGEEWNEEKAKEIVMKRELENKLKAEEASRKPEKFVPNSNYKEKYQHLIGLDAALEAAKKTETNKQYGFVPSENKKDQRSIEQTLADLQAKKRMKLSHQTETTSSSQ
ncbi:sperm-associated antigen 7 [Macrosteles quadrilineatus]|uniref:sperm-associated antigen 7 n=1 Tax=Macrosteles quadrilineatus TaxID=74068 RepID=UPI0023E140E0|nr:sperm-associated antigen 7 [Macrosteles quadrilineatus]